MDIIIALVVFIVGGLCGFFAARSLNSTDEEQTKLTKQLNKSEDALEQYKSDVAEHLSNSAKLLDQMNDTCQTAMKQMQESTQLLQAATTAEVESVPFFSAETEEGLAKTAAIRDQKRESEAIQLATNPPLDYSGDPSGIFSDQKQKVTTAE